MDSYIGMIMPWASPRIPRDWVLCDGRLLPINNYQALFSVLGVNYGGDGRTSFGIPDLRNRFAVGASAPTELGKVTTGVITSEGTARLSAANLPAHSHAGTVSLNGITPTTHISAGTDPTGSAVVPVDKAVLNASPTGARDEAAIYLAAGTTPSGTVNMGGVSSTVTVTGPVTLTVGKNKTTNSPFTVNSSFTSLPPFLGMNFIMCVNGLYPPRN